MARVTVEDCVLKIPNRFELVMVSSQRAREIGSGAPITVERDNDKNTVVSLREIADGTIDIDSLKESLVKNHQKIIEIEDEDEEIIDVMVGENEEWVGVAEHMAEEEAISSGLHTDSLDEEEEDLIEDPIQEMSDSDEEKEF